LNTDRVSSLFWLALGLVSMYGAVQLGLGTLREPGSGLLAFMAGAFVSLIALGIFVKSLIQWRGIRLDFAPLWSEANWRRPAIIGLLTLGFILALERLGFILTGFLLLLVLFRWVERFSWKKALMIPALTLGFSYLLFNVFLKATLPRGFLNF
jgi:putative tricarboxylic transport membrane protein